MLIKINQLEDTISDREQEVSELKNKIKRMLKKNADESERARQEHEIERKALLEQNVGKQKDLKTFLLNINH